MTSEVLIINNRAVVLAADSAVTVTSWGNGKQEERYFNGANKLFQLSECHPVGIMIYNGAAILDVSWELAIREFRKSFHHERCEKLLSYPERFFEWLRAHQGLFPDERRKTAYIESCATQFLAACLANSDRKSNADQFYKDVLSKLQSTCRGKPPEPFDEAKLAAAVAEFGEPVGKRILAYIDSLSEHGYLKPPETFAIHQIATAVIQSSIYSYKSRFSYTGLVFAGFGEEEFFPSFVEYRCFGFVANQFVVEVQNSKILSHTTGSDIVPFATTGMINTFKTGLSPGIFEDVRAATEATLRDFAKTILADAHNGYDATALEHAVSTSVTSHIEKWTYKAYEEHASPLLRVVQSLPISELASLAKTLIELTSLKERVTKPSQSVGGPIEVAVVTKHDGFIWIERKLYFRPELNTRFLAKQNQQFR